ncbi:Proline-rich nuclear receptor coactivator [Carex littledalei]|uniref:Proline-rich nuclear receptor coactivator n=1 Tax=Carex littledalei TaxID=544730 RepID=A0A833QXR3_9POAL|nr:Proline-rich nuclear receptor coactivator [Carex littledalei]
MEMLMVFAQHQTQYSRNKSHPSDQFASPPSKNFRAINCRTFQAGLTDLKSPPQFHSEPPKQLSKAKSKPISITPSKLAKFNSEDLSLCPPFAGPAYSNSPPPSSLPIPKFSLRQKRSVSLELPVCKSEIDMRPMAKSAPTSPTGERVAEFSLDVAIATENLRRILHLDDE